MTKRQIFSALPTVFLALAGCGGGGPALPGTWQLTDTTTGALIEQVTLGQDGSYALVTYDTGGMVSDRGTGTYKTSGADIVVDSTSSKTNQRSRVTTQFYVGQTLLAGPALLPQGAHQGIVGTWAGSVKDESLDGAGMVTKTSQFAATYTLKADKTVTTTVDSGTPPPSSMSGTWTDAGAGQYRLTFQGNTQTVTLIDDAALTTQAFHRPPAH